MALLCLGASEVFAQDKRPINNKTVIRQNRAKSVKKKEKATTRDLAGYKLRHANQSSAQRAVQISNASRKARGKSGDRAGQPIGGRPLGIRSKPINAGRANIYPQKGPFVNHSSKSPERAYNNRKELSRLARLQTRQDPPGRKKRITPRSNSQAYVTRGRKNVYWGKYSKGERAITTDLAGRPLRTKNFRTPANPLVKADNPYYGRNDRGDRAYKGTFRSGYATASRRGERAWKGDISGHAIRKSAGRDNQVAGQHGESPKILPGFSARLIRKDLTGISGNKRKQGGGSVSGMFRSNKPLPARQPGIGGNYMKQDFARLRGIKPEKGGGSVTGKYKSNTPLPPRKPGIGGNFMKRDFAKLKGIKPEKGGGSVTGKYRSNQPLMAKAPGANANFIRKDLGKLRGIKPIKGGGSITAQMKRGQNSPIAVRAPGNPRAASLQANYRGTIRRSERGFSNAGLSYSGNIPSHRQPKGGGSISGFNRNNNHLPIAVRQPLDQRAARFQGNYKGFLPRSRATHTFSQDGLSYTGNIKAARPLKGGGSISGSWNNKGQPIAVKTPGSVSARIATFQGNLRQGPKQFSQAGYGYSGDIRMRKKSFSREGYDWAGYTKASKPLKGGGSISGQLWNNKEQPLPAKFSGSKAAQFQGNLPLVKKSFSREGYDWAGYDRTRKPEKGGGSISGQLWNNKEQPLPPRIPTGKQASDIAYSGKIRLSRIKREFVRNPNAVEEALKKHSPYANVYMVNNITTRVKQRETGKNKLSAKEALAGLPPSRATAKAAEYAGTMKRYWEYKHNPSSADASLKTIKYSKAFADATVYGGKVRLSKNYRHAPNADKDALKVLAPGKAYARVADYQGNIRMNKFNHKKHFPDATFAHNKDNNVKGERTIFTSIKLLWSEVFKKQSTQPDAVKDKVRKPRYDKKEKELWKDLYD
ncbi:MAG TPA: hypothetical protein PKH83_00585 [Cyclobacteriaceae bacterium]|nr:hypothetical protein [Cyclobacteriaceae bacterium]HNU40953.1 hypothetical protein [Cyclobacteriaceae bacterium]